MFTCRATRLRDYEVLRGAIFGVPYILRGITDLKQAVDQSPWPRYVCMYTHFPNNMCVFPCPDLEHFHGQCPYKLT